MNNENTMSAENNDDITAITGIDKQSSNSNADINNVSINNTDAANNSIASHDSILARHNKHVNIDDKQLDDSSTNTETSNGNNSYADVFSKESNVDSRLRIVLAFLVFILSGVFIIVALTSNDTALKAVLVCISSIGFMATGWLLYPSTSHFNK